MHRILEDESIAGYEAELGRERIRRAAEEVIGRARLSGDGLGYDAIVAAVRKRLDHLRGTSPSPVINATGILLHTNLGRAPLSADAVTAVASFGGRYSNLEYDLETGERGSRHAAIGEALRTITGNASNYRIEGFAHDPSARDLVMLGRRAGVPVVEDLGGGALCDLAEYGTAHERTVQETIGDGVALVTFSGDKLIGGPQAGIVAGRANLIARIRNNPLLRALRVGKLTIAALGATLRCYRDRAARERLPLYRKLAATLDELSERAKAYVGALPCASAGESVAYLGGGALPQASIASIAIAVTSERPQQLAARLRAEEPPIVTRIERGRLLLDLRTIAPEEDRFVIASLLSAYVPL
jgi:seryl-tRNA(Sec) selenium transferase